jgi:glycosyltransferase involved in cell wall biosynthesis
MKADGTLCRTVDHRICAPCLADSPYLVGPLQRGASRAARLARLGRALHVIHRLAPRLTTAALRFMRRVGPGPGEDLVRALDARAAHLRERVREADLILTPTRFARDRAVEWGVPADKVRVLPLGVVAGPGRPRREGPRRRFGYVGTLAPHKGVHVLVEAVRGLSQADWTLDLFGDAALDPAYTLRLRALAQDDPRIRFRGPIAPDAQDRIWEALDLLVLPSLWWENSPLTVAEALAAGLPVVASHTGGLPEVLPEGAGVLVPPGDVEALRSALAGVLDGERLAGALDAPPLQTTSSGARELVALYAPAATGELPE